MKVLLMSTYELGHQPLGVASPAAMLTVAGHEVRAVDLAVESLDGEAIEWAEAVAISVPMHTAMRLARQVVSRVRRSRPTVPLALYGLYAGMAGDQPGVATIVGEYEPGLLEWLSTRRGGVSVGVERCGFNRPRRDILPGLDRYAHLQIDGDHRLVGYVELSHGCRHRCRHCPIPVVYDGRFRIVGAEPVLDDIAQLVDMGARHITFGDPDFLNGPNHTMRILEEAHKAHPDLTFDVTVKVEHLLRYQHLLEKLADCNVLFVVSAFETTDEATLVRLDKGHSVADMATALDLARRVGLDVRPSWLPFTPWTTPDQIVDLFEFLDRNDLFGCTDPVQLSIRLLIPAGSLLLDLPEVASVVGAYDPDSLAFPWTAMDARADELQAQFAVMAARAADQGRDHGSTLTEMWSTALALVGRDPGDAQIPAGATAGRPRLTEPWFC